MNHLFRNILIMALGCGLLLLAGCDSKETAEAPKAPAAPVVDQGAVWAKEYEAKLQDFYASTNGTMTVGSIAVDGKTSSYVLQDVAGSLRLVSEDKALSGLKIEYKIGAVEVTGVNPKPFAEDRLFADKVAWKDFSYVYDLPVLHDQDMGKASASAREYVFNGMQGDMDSLMAVLKKGEAGMADLQMFATLATPEMTFVGVTSEATIPGYPGYGDKAAKITGTMDSGFARDVAFIRCGASEMLNYKIALDDKPLVSIDKYSLKGLVVGDKPEQILSLILSPEQDINAIPAIAIDDMRAAGITVHLTDHGLGELTVADSGISFAFAKGKTKLAFDAVNIVIPKELEDMASLFMLGSGTSLSALHEGPLDLSFAVDMKMEEKDGKTFIDANNLFVSEKNLGNVTFTVNATADTVAATSPEPFGDMVNSVLVRTFMKVVDTGMVEFGSRLAATQVMPEMNPVEGGKAMRAMGVAMLDAQCRQFAGSRAELCNNVLNLLREPGTLEITVAPPTPIPFDADPAVILLEQGDEALGLTSSFRKN